MGIFIKRPLCLFCFSFIAAALAVCICGGKYNLYLFIALCVALAACTILSFIINKSKYGLIEAAIALLMAILAIVLSYFFIERVDLKREKYCGEDLTVEFVVLKRDYVSRYSSSYEGKIISVNGENVSIPAYLDCSYEGEYAVGDTVFTLVDIVKAQENGKNELLLLPRDINISAKPVVEKEQAIIYKSGLRFDVICAKIRESVRSRFMEILDFDSAALSTGLLTGDKSTIATEYVRDFRRAGLSHVLAVSGLHLALVVGSAELVLRRLYVKKNIRCVLLSLLSLVLLILSGFSASACRSVIMLLCAYLVYLLSRDSDALTSLGVAGFVIIFLSPRTVGDIGFWLSFLATFGLVTWLQLLKISDAKKKGRALAIVSSGAKKVWTVISTSLCAILSITIVSWYIFGEISVIGPLSNLVVTPLCELYLVISLITLVLGGIPILSNIFGAVLGLLCRVIYALAGFFSKMGFAVISLEYEFAGVIIVAATVIGFALLIIKLRHKRILLTIPALAMISFAICLSVFNSVYDGTRATYINDKNRDLIVFAKGNSAIIIDASDGTYSPFYEASQKARENYATEISGIVLTHYHAKHISTLESTLRSQMVRCVYVPMPRDDSELDIAHDIARCAENNDVALVIYGYDEVIEISDEMSLSVLEPSMRRGSTKKIINFCVNAEGKILTYADSSWELCDNTEETSLFIGASDVLILGAHGPSRPDGTPIDPAVYIPDTVIVSAADEQGMAIDFYIAPR